MKAVVLGAGKGKRLLSEQFDMPKVMRQVNGKPLIRYVLDNLDFIPKQDTIVVVGYKKEQVMAELADGYRFAVQKEQLGTGHAVKMTAGYLADCGDDCLVCYGDMPLFHKETFLGIVEEHKKSQADCTVLTAISDEKLPYGRGIRKDGKFAGVVEEKDCTEEQKKINELNVGIYVFKSSLLFHYLDQLKNSNAQGEYYLTDVPELMLRDGKRVETYSTYDTTEIYGVNTPEDLEYCEKILRRSAI